MAGPVAGARNWLAGFGSCRVVLTSPHPPGECARRLAGVTSARGSTSWYLDPRTVGLAVPRLRGTAGTSRIRVARFTEASGQGSFVPWLDGQLEPGTGGGATLTGNIGLPDEMKVLLPLTAGAGALIMVCLAGAGTVALASGHPGRGLPFLLGPSAMTVFMVTVIAAGRRQLQRYIPALVQELNSILDSTVSYPDRPQPPQRPQTHRQENR